MVFLFVHHHSKRIGGVRPLRLNLCHLVLWWHLLNHLRILLSWLDGLNVEAYIINWHRLWLSYGDRCLMCRVNLRLYLRLYRRLHRRLHRSLHRDLHRRLHRCLYRSLHLWLRSWHHLSWHWDNMRHTHRSILYHCCCHLVRNKLGLLIRLTNRLLLKLGHSLTWIDRQCLFNQHLGFFLLLVSRKNEFLYLLLGIGEVCLCLYDRSS